MSHCIPTSSLLFWQRQIDSIVFDILTKTIDGLQEYVYFSKIAAIILVPRRTGLVPIFSSRAPGPYPLPNSTIMEGDGIRSAMLSAYVSRTSISALVR
ncbi:hypothetical protein GMOD_00007485 [Pyrenophora seminiperda CCB06]|uniref:Uncharacterized protein n=1 Tax=Pyrenophora seminiperda CCB06 TaxID=1302712 RepID=A0A3M7MDA0_9PLEO|nr:hypothetical protein GMOD_00007485 [Pyrenophora seminiperda CCB06]